jgi:hypothetical protein
MSNLRAQAQVAVSVIGVLAKLATQRSANETQLAVEQARIGGLMHVVDALVSRRVDAVQASFAGLLEQYAEQARHFMAQQKQYADAELECKSAFRRAELRSRIQKLDGELSLIRIDARVLYAQMTDTIMALGGTPANFARDMVQPLALPSLC